MPQHISQQIAISYRESIFHKSRKGFISLKKKDFVIMTKSFFFMVRCKGLEPLAY